MPRAVKPVIGVTGPDAGGWLSWILTSLLIRGLGGRPVRLTPASHTRPDPLHALVLGGGADIDPGRYRENLMTEIRREGKPPRRWSLQFLVPMAIGILRRWTGRPRSASGMDTARDDLEFAVLEQALADNLPVLGICRGSQVINVHFGGSLYQDLRQFYMEEPQIRSTLPRKTVHIDPDSRLFAILGRRHLRVNSLHHQSVRNLGRGLKISARENNGVVQAIEHVSRDYVIGVQWHPEFLPVLPPQKRLFAALVRIARVRMQNRQNTPSPRGSQECEFSGSRDWF